MYECGKCGKSVELNSGGPVRCPYCGFKLLYKTRPKIVKRVDTK